MKAGLLMYRVLVADNYPIIRMAVKNLVEQLDNFKVIAEEATGIDASLRAEQGDIDIIIMDLAMPPGENGLVTIKRIHEHFPNTKIIIFSSRNEPQYINQAIYNGANSYILKSSSPKELVHALRHAIIRHAINGEKYLDNNIMVTKKDLLVIKGDSPHFDLGNYVALSKREQEILPLIVLGYTNKEIATKMFISPKTVEAHKTKIMQKLNLASHAELLHYAVKHRLADL